ncbi:MAG: hypothetical protein QOE70_4017 [Chthoniobacter sp.]|jgi:hypothetical protein|nr:hypothetical protein [Chthoniobacter sp.]
MKKPSPAVKPVKPAKAAKAPKQVTPAVPVVLTTPIAEFVTLSEGDRKVRFAEKAQINRVSFSELGKLHFLITGDIAAWNAANPNKSPRRIYKVLGEMGVSEKAVSNAEYASRIWRELAVPGHIDEAAFDALTFQDCFAIARSMSSRSALQLDGAAVGELIAKQPGDFDDELRSLYAHGVTVAEKTAQDELAEANRLKALIAAQPKAPAPVVPATPAVENETPADEPAGETTTPAVENATPPADTPAVESETPADETTTEVEPTNITNLPPQADPDKDLPSMLDVLDEIVKESENFTAAGQQSLLAKLDEARTLLAARIETAAAA